MKVVYRPQPGEGPEKRFIGAPIGIEMTPNEPLEVNELWGKRLKDACPQVVDYTEPPASEPTPVDPTEHESEAPKNV